MRVLNLTRTGTFVVVLAAAMMSGQRAHAQPGTVLSHQKISATEGVFTGILDIGDAFGRSAASLGDLDGDGVTDMAVGAWRDDDGCTDPADCNRGAVWILFLNTDGTVKSHQKISDTEGGFTGILDDVDLFGISVASLGDLDGVGPSVLALAVGAGGDDDGGSSHGAVWILFLDVDTTGLEPVVTVLSHQKISDSPGGLPGLLDDVDNFGLSVTSLGDLDGVGPSVLALAVGAWRDDDGGIPPDADRGAVWILFLNADGTVSSHQKISDTEGNFTGILEDDDGFGLSVASLGDLDGVGPSVLALAVGAPGVDGSFAIGEAWILFLNDDGTVNSHQMISNPESGGAGFDDRFGASMGSLGDLDGDGVGDLAVGAFRDNDGGLDRGAVWILFLNTDGTVNDRQKISGTQGNFTGILNNSDQFGIAAAPLGDLNGDGVVDLAVGAQFDDDGVGPNRGAIWILFLDGICPWDCGDSDGNVGIVDFLALLAQWGGAGSCDFDDGIVGINDFLELLANWGSCP